MAHVAFIGVGRMGHGMAGRYLDSGFTVAVWNRSKAKADDLVARGARWASSPADAADGADAVVAMVAAWGRISTATADVFDDQFDFRR